MQSNPAPWHMFIKLPRLNMAGIHSTEAHGSRTVLNQAREKNFFFLFKAKAAFRTNE